MYTTSETRINLFGMKRDYQLITSPEELTDLQELLETCIPEKIVTGKATLNEIKEESENFMKSNFNLHKILHADLEEVDKDIGNMKAYSEVEILEEFNKLGREIDIYKLPIKLLMNKDYWCGGVGNVVLPLSEKELLAKEKIIYSHISLSEDINRLTIRILSHEVTHSQIDSNRGAINYYQNYEVIPIFIELLHNSPAEDSEFFTNTIIMIRENSLFQYIKYLKDYYSLGKQNIEKQIEASTYLISTLKALNLYEVYLNSRLEKQHEIINQIQRIFDGKMKVEELLEKNNITLENGIESTKRIAKQKKREFVI